MPPPQRVGPPLPARPLCSVPKLLVLTGFAVVVCNFLYRSPPVKPAEPVVIRPWEPPQPRPTATPPDRVATPPALDGTVDAALRLAVPLGHGPVLLTFGDSSFHQGTESSYQLSFDFLFHTGLPINKIRRVGQFLVPCDSNGTATFPFWDGGNLAGTVVFQGVVTDVNGSFIGSSAAAFH